MPVALVPKDLPPKSTLYDDFKLASTRLMLRRLCNS
jgi:hypothetical protein